MKLHYHTLKNGLSTIFIDTGSFPSITSLILVGAGSRYENRKNNGIAHFFEHMAFKGSKDYTDAHEIAATIEGLGGVFNAFTSKDHTGYWVKAPATHLEKVVHVLSDMLLHPKLDPEEIEREKGVIIEEINMYEDMPSSKVGDIFDDLMFAGHPLEYEIAGTKESVTAATQQTFIDYRNTYYHPSNAVVVIAGGLGFDQKPAEGYIKLLEKYFDQWAPGEKVVPKLFVGKPDRVRVRAKKKKTEQAHFCVGFPAFSFSDERRYALGILATILGGGMASRLFHELRERRGLCYYVSTGREMYEDTGYIVTQAGVSTQKDKITEAIKLVVQEHRSLVKNITDEEITRAKEVLKGRMVLSLEDSHNTASFFGVQFLLQGSKRIPQEMVQLIDAVTKDQLIHVAEAVFMQQPTIAVLSPFSEKELELETIS
ncbi:MAG: M16 family metallopeptidase [Weeksellaceae bacterium]